MRSNCDWYAATSFALKILVRASPTEFTRREDGKICTRFSSRLTSFDSSSQDTAVRTLVSSVAESRANAASSSSPRISPAVAMTS